MLKVCTEEAHADLPPGQIVPRLADAGVYLASESTMYRVLREEGLQHHRGRAKAPSSPKAPTTHCAFAPNEAWCWDITWLPGPIRGQFFFLYLILDLFSARSWAGRFMMRSVGSTPVRWWNEPYGENSVWINPWSCMGTTAAP